MKFYIVVAPEFKFDHRLFVLWNVNRPGYLITQILCQATCMVIYGERQHIMWRNQWHHKMVWICFEKKKKKKKSHWSKTH